MGTIEQEKCQRIASKKPNISKARLGVVLSYIAGKVARAEDGFRPGDVFSVRSVIDLVLPDISISQKGNYISACFSAIESIRFHRFFFIPFHGEGNRNMVKIGRSSFHWCPKVILGKKWGRGS